MRSNTKIFIGFITYGNTIAKYLPYFLSSLTAAGAGADIKIIALDNTEEENNENRNYIKNNCPQINFYWAGKNLGFSRAYNRMISEAVEEDVEYFFMVNPDTLLEVDAISKLMAAMESDQNLAAVSPKVLRWDFINQKKTNVIDTLGISLRPGLRFVDAGQCEIDQDNLAMPVIIGPSGVAGLFRIGALEKVKENGEYFDERMFMYKEDCDLAYRLYLAGLNTKIVPAAVIYHDRTVAGQGESNLQIALNRKHKSRQAKIWSFRNQQIIYRKYWHLQNWQEKLAIIWQEIKMIIFALLFERYLLKELVIYFKK